MRKRRSSLPLFPALFLSFAIVSLSVTGSIQAINEEHLRDACGTWYAAIPAGLESDEERLREREWLDRLGVCESFGEIAAHHGAIAARNRESGGAAFEITLPALEGARPYSP